jgi:hypothetical protein
MRGEVRSEGVAGAGRDLSWLDLSAVTDMTPGGESIVLESSGEGGGPAYGTYLRSTDGSAPVRLGSGRPTTISPDGNRVISIPIADPNRLDLVSTGRDGTLVVRNPEIKQYLWASWFPRGDALLVSGNDGTSERAYVQGLDGSLRPLSPRGERQTVAPAGVSPDGKRYLAWDREGLGVFSTEDGHRLVKNLPDVGTPFAWADARSVYIQASDNSKGCLIEKLDLGSKQRQLVRNMAPPDGIGVLGCTGVALARDGKTWVYSYNRELSELYLVTGLEGTVPALAVN